MNNPTFVKLGQAWREIDREIHIMGAFFRPAIKLEAMFTESKSRLFDAFAWVSSLSKFASFLMTIAIGSAGFAIDPNCVAKVDWTTLPSTYSHDGMGNPVKQYAQGIQPVSNESPDFQRSGFRHTRSTLQAGDSSDNFHIVERWGSPVQPYGEWRYPYRPYSVPYGAWGPQSPLVNAPQSNSWNAQFPGFQPGLGGGGNIGQPDMGPMGPMGGIRGMQSGIQPGFPQGSIPQGNWQGNSWPQGFNHNGFGNNGFGVGPNNALRPDQDDYYAPALDQPPVSDRDFFFVPNRP